MRLLSVLVLAAQLAGNGHPASGAVFGDWHTDRPGLRHRIAIPDLPMPYETRSVGNPPQQTPRPEGAKPKVPDGLDAALFAEGLKGPRLIRVAPNGDLFVAESAAGRIRVLRPGPDGKLSRNSVYADGLRGPFGIAFYPPGAAPKWVYIGENNRVVRFPYAKDDLEAKSPPEVVVAELAPTSGGHVTRDVAFSNDGGRMFVSVGSATNVAQGMAGKTPAWQAKKGFGEAVALVANGPRRRRANEGMKRTRSTPG